MRITAITVLAACTALLWGCGPQQKVEAGQAAQRANQNAASAAHTAGNALTDAGITLRVKTAMGTSSQLNTSGINVNTHNRVVYLSGVATSSQQKALALRIARDTLGPKFPIVDQLAVQPAPQTVPSQ